MAKDEIERLARRVAREPMNHEAIARLAQAVSAATGRPVEVIQPAPGGDVAARLVSAGMRLSEWVRIRRDQGLHTWTMYPDMVRSLLVDRDGKGLRVNWSELAMHSRCAGAELLAWAVSRDPEAPPGRSFGVIAAWIDRERGDAGTVEGVGTEVLPPEVDRATRSYIER